MVLAAAAESEVLIAQDAGADFPARLAMPKLLGHRMGHELRRKPGVRPYAQVPEVVLWPQQRLTQTAPYTLDHPAGSGTIPGPLTE